MHSHPHCAQCVEKLGAAERFNFAVARVGVYVLSSLRDGSSTHPDITSALNNNARFLRPEPRSQGRRGFVARRHYDAGREHAGLARCGPKCLPTHVGSL